MERLRNDLLERIRLGRPADASAPPPSFADFLSEYRFLFLGDLISLVFCNGWTEPAAAEGYRIALQGDAVTISPDPFGGHRIPLEVPARQIPDRPYESDADLAREIARAPFVTLTGRAEGVAAP
jgi:hypothetical protein